MNTQTLSAHQSGMKVMVQCHISRKNKCEYFPGTIESISSALDRNYRVNVVMDNGDYIANAAPECVVPA